MRPVRVTAPGAGLSLPLRMVAAGTGATVGITLWVVADGRYEPQNFPFFVISPSDLVWDWSTQSSNYTTLRAAEEAQRNDAAWQIESSTDVSPYLIEQQVIGSPNDYLPVPALDGGSDGAPDDADATVSAGESSQQVEQDDLSTLFPAGNQSTVRITRMRGDLSHAALATDLALQASADQSALSNVYQVTKSVNAPTCPPVMACPPCPPTLGNPFGGVGGGPFGGVGNGSGSGSSYQGGMSSGSSKGAGCSSTASSGSGRAEESGAGPELMVLALTLVGIGRGWMARRRRRSP
jgi:hypothetical protein